MSNKKPVFLTDGYQPTQQMIAQPGTGSGQAGYQPLKGSGESSPPAPPSNSSGGSDK